LKEAGTMASSMLRFAAVVDRIAAVLRDEAVPAGVASVRGEYGKAVRPRECHELSFQNCGR
jgi:hypothetical protein